MDLQISLIFIGLFVIASLSLLFVFKFGIKEKSYEEALAEQRQQTQALLGIKPKPKEKKNKKAKKIKEIEESENNPSDVTDKKAHVEFKEGDEIKGVPPKKKFKKDKVKPILLNKVEVFEKVITKNIEVPQTNNFEKLHPKDDFELRRSSSVHDDLPAKPIKSKQKDSDKPKKNELPKKVESVKKNDSPKKSSKKINETPKVIESEKISIGKEVVKKVNTTTSSSSSSSSTTSVTTTTINPTSGTTVTGSSSTNTVKEKKKKKNDIPTLQQLNAGKNGTNVSILLDLVRKADLSRSEVQILIDLLLNKQHEAPAKMDEWSEGKSDPVQKLKKQLAEKEKALIQEQEALKSAQAKLREVRSEQINERGQLHQKIRNLEDILNNKQLELNRIHGQCQQLQVQLNDEIIKVHKLHDDLNTIQLQRKQYEIRLAQAKENDVIIQELKNEIEQLNGHNQQLIVELKRLTDERLNEKNSYDIQINNFKIDIDEKIEKQKQLEEINNDNEKKLDKYIKKENDFIIEIKKLNTNYQQQSDELRRLELGNKQYQNELYNLQKQKDEYDKIINDINEEKLQSKIKTLNILNELSSLKDLLQQNDIKHKNQLEITTNKIDNLEKELNEQKIKNNDLRQKNWKVMEALKAAENRISTANNTKIDLNEFKEDIIKTEQKSTREFIQRLFPNIQLNDNLNNVEIEKLITDYIVSLDNNKIVKDLEMQIKHYKSVIDSTEKMLSNLQKHIEEEEINWRNQLQTKTMELETLKQFSNQLQKKIINLERKLNDEENEKKLLIEKYHNDNKQKNNDTKNIELIGQLSDEINRLNEQLQKTQENNGICNNTNSDNSKLQNCNSTNGPSLIEGNGN